MKIVAYFHLFPPEHNAGSETTVLAALRAMARRGHEVQVICDRSVTAPYTIDGVNVHRPPRRGQQAWINDFAKDADLLVTHLDLTRPAMQLALDVHRPLVHFSHNDAQLAFHYVTPNKAQLVVFNSYWVAEKEISWEYNETPCRWKGPSIVVHPIVEPEHYQCETGDAITLVNPTPGKGAHIFYELARQMPDRKFLAVTGGYGEQMPIPPDLRNVTLLAHTPDIREVFRQTRILLMPSEYESYGRVGVEAACAGIPTIAHPTPGLTEAFGDAGIFHDRKDIPAWATEIDRLLTDEVYYSERSKAVLELADSLDPEAEFDRLEAALIKTATDWANRSKDGMERMWTSDRRLYKRADGSITENQNEAQSLFCAEGGRIPESIAIELGLTSAPAVRVTPDLDTKALLAPDENKAIESPAENKGKRKKAA